MKRSAQVRLLVTTSLLAPLAGCSQGGHPPGPAQASGLVAGGGDDVTFDPTQTYANNAYVPGLGYYHAASQWWYPYPVNYYMPGFGYFWGGSWYGRPRVIVVPISVPDSSRSYAWFTLRGYSPPRGAATSGWASSFAGRAGPVGVSPHAVGAGQSGIGRGGFGSSGHGGFGHSGGG